MAKVCVSFVCCSSLLWLATSWAVAFRTEAHSSSGPLLQAGTYVLASSPFLLHRGDFSWLHNLSNDVFSLSPGKFPHYLPPLLKTISTHDNKGLHNMYWHIKKKNKSWQALPSLDTFGKAWITCLFSNKAPHCEGGKRKKKTMTRLIWQQHLHVSWNTTVREESLSKET